jgi:hypothetical protein
MAIVKSLKLTKDAEVIINYLFGTKNPMDRHKKAIREACHLMDMQRAEKALKELIEARLIHDGGESLIELTEAGIQTAQTLQKQNQAPTSLTQIRNSFGNLDSSASVNVVGVQDIYSTPLSHDHLLRAGTTDPLPAVPMRRRPASESDDIEETLSRSAPQLPSITLHPMRNGIPEPPALAKGAKPARPKGVSMRFMLAFDNQRDALPLPIVHGDLLGRGKKCTIIFKHDEYISNRHCRFEVTRDKATGEPALFVEDVGSRNGTFVDDFEVYDGKVHLQHGSRLRVGETVLVVVEIPY